MNIIRVLPGVYNEADIIEENIKHYSDQGIPSIVIDNGSDDGTYEICQKFRSNEVIEMKQLVTKEFQVQLLLRTASLLCRSFKPDWIIWADADEFIEPIHKDQTLKENIIEANSKNRTIFRTFVAHFRMTNKDDNTIRSVQQRMKYYFIENDGEHYKVWKNSDYVDIFHPHSPVFFNNSEKKIADNILIIKHYPLRTIKQIKRKLRRLKPSSVDPFGWSIHYLKMKESDYILNSQDLCHYNDDRIWNFDKKINKNYYDLSTVINYYVNESNEHLESLMEHLKQKCKSEDDFLLLAAHVYKISGNKLKEKEYLKLAHKKTIDRLQKIDNLLKSK